MATKIVTKNSSTASAVPTASDLVQGELAVNVADKRLFTEDNAGAIVELGTNPSALTVTGEITANGGIALGDGDVATFGDSDDLSIFHAGGTTYLTNTTGSLVLRTDSFRVLNTANSEQILHGDANGAVTAYYDNAAKLATTSTGIDVTGRAVVGSGSFDGGGVIHNYGSDGNSRSWWTKTDTHGYGDFAIRQSTTQTGSTYQTRLLIDSSGNVGIGTSSPAGKLTLKAGDNSYAGGFRIEGTDETTALAITHVNGDNFFSGNGTDDHLVLTGTGNVGIGNSSPVEMLTIGSTSDTSVRAQFLSSTTGAGTIQFGDGTGASAYSGYINYTHSDNALAFATGSSERMRIDGSGRLGLGVTPEAWSSVFKVLRVGTGSSIAGESGGTSTWFNTNAYYDGSWKRINTNTSAQIAHTSDGKHEFKVAASGSANSAISWNTAMTVDNSGNVLVGTTSTIPFLLTSGTGAGITSSGTIMGAAAAEAALFNRVSGDGAVVSFFRTGTGVGNISVGAGSTSYNTSSDQRLKENIADADDAGSKIDAIQVRQYDWKADGSHQDYGMIAQELQTVAPEAVHQPEDSEEMMGVDYSKLVPMLIKEIQSLRNRVAQLEE